MIFIFAKVKTEKQVNPNSDIVHFARESVPLVTYQHSSQSVVLTWLLLFFEDKNHCVQTVNGPSSITRPTSATVAKAKM